jgi:hypothetical protein
MKSAALLFSSLGVLSGLLSWALGLWYAPVMPIDTVVGPMILGSVLLATHTLNIRKVRNAASRTPRSLLIGLNFFLSAFCALGLLYLIESSHHSVLFLVCFGVVFVLPLALDGIYFVAFHSGVKKDA